MGHLTGNLFAASVLGSLAIFALAPAHAQTPATAEQPQTLRTVPQTQAEITLSFAPVVQQAAPAVVNIYTKKIIERRRSPFAGDPFFERFFRDMFPNGRQGKRIENSLGSGVILDSSGIVVSNYHVVGEADEITVVLQDRREFLGTVMLADEDSDLAVLRLAEAEGLPTLAIRDSDSLEVGDLVLAIGNPFGVGQTVTSGIVSGLARSRGTNGGGVFIQTDAAINPGNSGGALVDMQGQLVGVNTAILSRSGGSNGIGFAVPANLVSRVVASAIAGESALVRPWFGFDGQVVDSDIAEAVGLATPKGVIVEAVHPDGILSASGIVRGDVIVGADGAPINTIDELEFRAATKPLGQRLEVAFVRDGEQRATMVTLASAPETPERDRRSLVAADGLPGLTALTVNPAVIAELGLAVESHGVYVLDVRGPARRVGLRQGDFVRRVNGQDVATTAELVAALQKTQGNTVLAVQRDGRTGNISYRR